MESVKSALAIFLCATIAAPPASFAQSPSPAPSPINHRDAAITKIQHRPAYQAGQLEGDDRILQALNRFTFGPRPGGGLPATVAAARLESVATVAPPAR